jgi:hypothetical protein
MKRTPRTRAGIVEMANEIRSRSSGCSHTELAEIISQVMTANGYDPTDMNIRMQIRDSYLKPDETTSVVSRRVA